MATLNFLTNYVEITPASTGWQEVDVSSHGVPADAGGVILYCRNTSTSGFTLGFRPHGSTSAQYPSSPAQTSSAGLHCWAYAKVDASGIFECLVGNTTSWDIYLVGYFSSNVVFFDGIDTTPPSLGVIDATAWASAQTYDISSYVGTDTPVAGIYEYAATALAFPVLPVARVNSSWSPTSIPVANASNPHFYFIIPVDANGQNQWIKNGTGTSPNLTLVGYIKDTADDLVWQNPTPTTHILSSDVAWEDYDAVSASATGYIGYICSNASSGTTYGYRKKGHSGTGTPPYDNFYYSGGRTASAVVQTDSSGVIQGKHAVGANVNLWIWAHQIPQTNATVDASLGNATAAGLTASVSGGGTALADPQNVTAAMSGNDIQVSWQHEDADMTFDVERSVDGGGWQAVT